MTTFAFHTERGNREYTNRGRTIDELVSLFSTDLYDREDGSVVDGSGHVVMSSYERGQETGIMDFDGENDRYDVKDEDGLDEDDWRLLERAYRRGEITDPSQRDSVRAHIEEEDEWWR